MTPQQKLERVRDLRMQANLLEMEAYKALPSCHRCIHLGIEPGGRGVKPTWCHQWKQYVPPEHLPTGCDKYDFDEIPF
jgi:hypothetical protein